jgi:hypothetical protein
MGNQRRDGRPQSTNRGQFGYLRVRHHLGNQIGRDRHTSQKVPAPAKHPDPWHVAACQGCRAFGCCLVRHTLTESSIDVFRGPKGPAQRSL